MQDQTKHEGRVLEVVCAVLVDAEDRILAVQRPASDALGGMWEFPGGKIESGECPVLALRRELREELNLDLDVIAHPIPLKSVTHAYEHATIRLSGYLMRCEKRPRLELLEHADLRWILLSEAGDIAWAAADVPILEEVSGLIGNPSFANGLRLVDT